MQKYSVIAKDLLPRPKRTPPFREVGVYLHSEAQAEIAAKDAELCQALGKAVLAQTEVSELLLRINARDKVIKRAGEIARWNNEQIAALTADLAAAREALEGVLPMARGYAADHPVGNNQQIVNQAQAALGKEADHE